MNTPYNTGKVKIGLRYQAPPPTNDRDMDRVQTALTPPCPRIMATHRADVRKSLIDAVLWTASVGLGYAVLQSPAIWAIFN